MKARIWSLAFAGLFGCKSVNKDGNLSEEEAIAKINGNRYSMISAYVYDQNFRKVDYGMENREPGFFGNFAHMCFFETEWIYNVNAKSNKLEDVIKPVRGNLFDRKKLTTPVSEFTIDLPALKAHIDKEQGKYHGATGQQWAHELENYERRGTADLSHFSAVALMLIGAGVIGGTGGAATVAVPLTPPVVAAILGTSALLGNRIGGLVFRAKGKEIRLADNIYQTIDPKIVDVKKLSTQSDYATVKKTISARVREFRDIVSKGKKGKKCEELLPLDTDLREELLKYSRLGWN